VLSLAIYVNAEIFPEAQPDIPAYYKLLRPGKLLME